MNDTAAISNMLKMLIGRTQCDQSDLQRYRKGEPYRGKILESMIFEWDPDHHTEADTCQVDRSDGSGVWAWFARTGKIEACGLGKFRQNVVLSMARRAPFGRRL